MVTGIIRTKMFALVLGVSGVGLISQFTNFINLLNFVVPLGLPFSMTKFVSENENGADEIAKKTFEDTLKLILLSSFITSFLLIIFSSNISSLLTNDISYSSYIIIIAVFIPFSFVNSLLEAYVRGIKNIDLLTKLLILSSTLSTIITVPLVIYFKLTGAIISISGSSLIILIFYIYYFRKNNLLMSFSFKNILNTEIIKKLMKLGIASLLIGAINQISYLTIRIITINNLGLEANGIYQSVLAISLNYFSLLFVFIANYTFPKINSIKIESEFLKEINDTFRVFLYLLTPLVGFIITARVLLINIFYSSAFSESLNLFKFQFLGDFFKSLAWVIGIWIIPRNKIVLWILLELISYSLYPFIYLLLLNKFSHNIESASVSYLIANIIHFSLNLFFIKKYINFKFSNQNFSMFLISLSFTLMIIAVSEWNITAGYFLIIPVLVLWLFIVSDKSEKDLFKEFIFKARR